MKNNFQNTTFLYLKSITLQPEYQLNFIVMKKTILFCAFCALAICVNAQSYDDISLLLGKKDASERIITETDSFTYVSRQDVRDNDGSMPDSEYVSVLQKYGVYDVDKATMTLEIPTTIYENYMIGKKCMTAGWTTFIMGTVFSCIGGICMGAAKVNPNASKAGAGFLYVGGAFVAVSLPLLTFGDHIKRETNKDLKLWYLRK